MLKTKRIKTFFSSIILLFALVSFSGFTSTTTPLKKPQTELVTKTNSVWNSSEQHNYSTSKPLKVSFNQYTVFSFSYFLNKQLLDFNITFKSQNKKTLEFMYFNSILEQNLIAQTQASKFPFIK